MAAAEVQGETDGTDMPETRYFILSALNGLMEIKATVGDFMPAVIHEAMPNKDSLAPHQLVEYTQDLVEAPNGKSAMVYGRVHPLSERDVSLIIRALTDDPLDIEQVTRTQEALRWVDQTLDIARQIQLTTGGDNDTKVAAYSRAAEAIIGYLSVVPVLNTDEMGEYIRRLVWVLIQARSFKAADEAADVWLRKVRLPYSMIQKIRNLQQTARIAAQQEEQNESTEEQVQ